MSRRAKSSLLLSSALCLTSTTNINVGLLIIPKNALTLLSAPAIQPLIMNKTNNRNPVVLVHGIIRTSSVFRRMAAYLTQQGWSVYAIDLTPNNATLPLEE